MDNKFRLNSSHLKIIAMILLLIDHIGYFFVPVYGDTATLYLLMRGIGRLGFPLYAFFIVEGMFYTRNIRNYLLKILGLTLLITTVQLLVLSEPLKNYFTIEEAYNVFLTLFTGAATIAYFQLKKYKHVYLLFPLVAMIITNILGFFYQGDWQLILINEYRLYGIAIILGFYLARVLTPRFKENMAVDYAPINASINSPEYTQKINNYLSCISLLFVNLLWYILSVTQAKIDFDGFQTYSIFTGLLLLVYNGKKGYQPAWFRWVYYFYYPAHLAILAVIGLIIS